jgi:hypothetical protein
MSGFFSPCSSRRSTSSFRYSSARSWNSVVEMSVGTVGTSCSSLSLGGGFSTSGMMLRVRAEALKARIEALGMDAAATRAMMPLAGVEARRGVAAARRSAREAILVAGFMVMEYRGIVLV